MKFNKKSIAASVAMVGMVAPVVAPVVSNVPMVCADALAGQTAHADAVTNQDGSMTYTDYLGKTNTALGVNGNSAETYPAGTQVARNTNSGDWYLYDENSCGNANIGYGPVADQYVTPTGTKQVTLKPGENQVVVNSVKYQDTLNPSAKLTPVNAAATNSSSSTSSSQPAGNTSSSTSTPTSSSSSSSTPAAGSSSTAAKPAGSQSGPSSATSAVKPSTAAQPAAASAQGQTQHKVAAGETLSQIAKDNGTTVGAIVKANPEITNPDAVRVGTNVVIPGGAVKAAAPVAHADGVATVAHQNQAAVKQGAAQNNGGKELEKTGAAKEAGAALTAGIGALFTVGAVAGAKKRFNI